jgi:hypothetical protein
MISETHHPLALRFHNYVRFSSQLFVIQMLVSIDFNYQILAWITEIHHNPSFRALPPELDILQQVHEDLTRV